MYSSMLDLRRDLLVSGTPCVTCVLEMAPTHDNVAVNGCGRYNTDDVVDYKKVSDGGSLEGRVQSNNHS